MTHSTLPISLIQEANGNLLYKPIYQPLNECENEGDEIFREDMRRATPDELLKFPAYHSYCIDGHVLTCAFDEGVRTGLTDDYSFMVTYTADDWFTFTIMRDMTSPEKYESSMRSYFGEYADRAMKLYPFGGSAESFTQRISLERLAASAMMPA